MKDCRIRNLAQVLALLLLLFPIGRLAARQPRRINPRDANPGAARDTRPRLVLLIVVDQFRYDYLTRFGDLFGSTGIGRLMRNGASWTEANFDHVPTFTAPGHAV